MTEDAPAYATEVEPRQNGIALEAPDPPRFRLASPLYDWVELRDDWAGARLKLWLNPGMGLIVQVTATNQGALLHLHELVQEWNLEDAAGVPLPLSAAGTAQLEPDMVTAILDAWAERRTLSKRR